MPVPRKAFIRLLTAYPELKTRILDVASHELLAAQDHMTLLGRKTARERMGSLLISQEKRAARRGEPSSSIRLPMTPTDIADYLGLTTETVSRTIMQLRADGMIRLADAETVHIVSRVTLENIESPRN